MALILFIFLAPLPLSKRTGVSTRRLRVSDTRCVCSAIIIHCIKVIYWIPEKREAITWPHTLTYKVSAMVLRQGNKWLGGCHLLNSSNLAEKLWNSWVLSTSVCSAGSFSAHTATYSTSESAHETQRVSSNLRNQKIGANFYRWIISCLPGPLETNLTGTPNSFSINSMYLRQFSGRSS